MKKAIVIGATGLIGSHLVRQLLQDPRFESVRVFARRPTGINDPKLEEFLVDFGYPDEWLHLVKGSVLFSSLGTTLQQAGTQEAQHKVDYTFQLRFAEAAARNGVGIYVLVSASNATADSPFFYARLKATLEREIKKLPFLNIHILQPGPLEGKREKERITERLIILALKALNKVGLLRAIRPIPGLEVAKAMIKACFRNHQRLEIYSPEKIRALARKEPGDQPHAKRR